MCVISAAQRLASCREMHEDPYKSTNTDKSLTNCIKGEVRHHSRPRQLLGGGRACVIEQEQKKNTDSINMTNDSHHAIYANHRTRAASDDTASSLTIFSHRSPDAVYFCLNAPALK